MSPSAELPQTASSTTAPTTTPTPKQPLPITRTAARRRSAPIYHSPQLKSSYGAPASESAALNPSFAASPLASARRSSPAAMYNRSSSSLHSNVNRGIDEGDNSNDSALHQTGSAAIRQAQLGERTTTIGRNKVNGSSLNNTSVNIATAIFQAEQGRFALAGPSTPGSSNGSFAKSSSYMHKETYPNPNPSPSSPSIEASSSTRRGPLPPPARTMSPADDVASLEAERARRRRERTKSPVLEAIAGAARALSPVSYLLKPRVAQGAPFPTDDDYDFDNNDDGAGYRSFSSFRQTLNGGGSNSRRSPTPQQANMQDASYLSANSAADVSLSSALALGASDRSLDENSQASDYSFEEEERLMAEMEAKRARVEQAATNGVQLGHTSPSSRHTSKGGWFDGLGGFNGGLSRASPYKPAAKKTPKQKGSTLAGESDDRSSAYDGSSNRSTRSSDSYDGSSDAQSIEDDEDPAKPTKTTSRRRPRRVSDDAKTYKYRPGDSASEESDSTDGRSSRRRRSSGKVTAHGAEGMAPVIEGKKRRRAKTARTGRAAAELGNSHDDSWHGNAFAQANNSDREQEDSFTVRFHPGAQTSPPTSPERVASAQKGRSGPRPRPSLGLPNPVAGFSELLLALLRALLVALIFAFNTVVGIGSWLAAWPTKATDHLLRSLSLADWSKLAKPLAVVLGLALLASLLGRRSAPTSPLEDVPSSWRTRMPTVGSNHRQPTPFVPSTLPPDSVEALLERIARVEDTLGAVSSRGRRDVEALTAQLGGLERRFDLSDRTMTALDSRITAQRIDYATLEQRVAEAERTAKQALDAALLARTAADAIERHLPARLAVQIDPQTKALAIDPAFWHAMRDVFVEQHALPSSVSKEIDKQKASLLAGLPTLSAPAATASSKPALWADFLAANEAALQAWSDGQLDRQIQGGAIVSRPEFLRILRAELSTAQVELDQRLEADLRRTGEDAVRSSLAESTVYADKVVRAALARLSTPPSVPMLAHPANGSADSMDNQAVAELVSSLIDAALLRHSKDTLAMADYALFSAGGRIIPHITSDTFEQPLASRWGGLLKPKGIPGRPPATALLPDINVGNCWPFAGSSGQVGILLARRVLVSAITIEHAAREVSFDMAAAPRDVEVWGLVEGQANLEKVATYQEGRAADATTSPSSLPPSPGYVLLGHLTYDINSPQHIQTFAVPQDIQDLGVDIGIVVVRIASNYGADYTCLYRVRVHGETAPDTFSA